MYETEANHRTESADSIPAAIVDQFGEMRGKITARSVLPWSEHCTECAWPTCYTTCDLYSPREDARCRRFADGMVRIDCPTSFNSYLLKITFKQWGKLWSPASVSMLSTAQAQAREAGDYRLGRLLVQLPIPAKIKAPVTRKRYSWKKKVGGRPAGGGDLPTSFLFECYNPGERAVRLSLTLRAVDEATKIPFQQLIEVTPGFHRVRVSMEEIGRVLNVRQPFNIELIPNDVEGSTTLYFGLMDFVHEPQAPAKAAAETAPSKGSKIKCIVWDLDHTMWTGILVEDGQEKLTLKPGIGEILRDLDARGILHSIASKNNHEEAMRALRQFGLEEYFLCPQISWQPKSEAIATIAQQLNIGRDTLLFVDDSAFERDQVAAVHPEVRTLDALEYQSIPQMKECLVPVTAESRERRRMYQVEAARNDVAQGFGDDYLAFLRHCGMQLVLTPMTGENLDRVHELTQRTNQMNFSGTRYDREVLKAILAIPAVDTYVLSCEDRFGSYGIVGFSLVDTREPRMTDLMFSCRVQSKRVEHAFLTHILRRYIAETGKDFMANYRKTPRNAPSGRVFEDVGMEELETADGVTSLIFPRDKEIPDDQVVNIVDRCASVGAIPAS
jgi:FkbH-like protein